MQARVLPPRTTGAGSAPMEYDADGYPLYQLELSQGLLATVDGVDYRALRQHKWSATRRAGCAYAVRWARDASGVSRVVYLHREIMGLGRGDGLLCDHRNGDGLDNRRANLRVATKAQNAHNMTSSPNRKRGGFKGVSWHDQCRKWQAHIRLPVSADRSAGHHLALGLFGSAEEAARAYDRVAREAYGSFAALNFPDADGASR